MSRPAVIWLTSACWTESFTQFLQLNVSKSSYIVHLCFRSIKLYNYSLVVSAMWCLPVPVTIRHCAREVFMCPHWVALRKNYIPKPHEACRLHGTTVCFGIKSCSYQPTTPTLLPLLHSSSLPSCACPHLHSPPPWSPRPPRGHSSLI